MASLKEWREILGVETDREAEIFVDSLRKFLDLFLDDYFRDEFKTDDV
jgi:hypothetical protein